MRRGLLPSLFGVLGCLLFGGLVAGQEEILTLSIAESVVDLAAGGRAEVRLRVANESIWQADDVEILWGGGSGIGFDPQPPTLKAVRPFETAIVPLGLTATAEMEPGDVPGTLDVVYTYCVGDLCYQVVDAVDVLVRLSPPLAETSGGDEAVVSGVPSLTADDLPARTVFPWQWLGFLGIGVVAIGALRLAKTRQRVAFVTVLVLCVAALAWGVSLGQHRQAQAVGAVLCTSCVGIETVSDQRVRLTDVQREALRALSEPIELLVFYAPWCHACPYAEEVVDLCVAESSVLLARHVNAEEEGELAEVYGVSRGGRIVVPAIVRVDTGEVVRGVDRLLERLLRLVEATT